MSETKRPLAIVGAGSMGQAFAGLLALTGRSVTLLASPTTAERLRVAGAIRLRGEVEQDVPIASAPAPDSTVGLTTHPAELPRGAGVMFMTKGHQLRAAIAQVRAAWPAADDREAWVAGPQNGVVKDEWLAEAFGGERVIGFASVVGAERLPTGEILLTHLADSWLGELSGGSSPRVEALAAALSAARLPTEVVPNVREIIWSKACHAIGAFAITCLARVSAAEVLRNSHLAHAYLSLVREAGAVAIANGMTLGDYGPIKAGTYAAVPESAALAALDAGVAARRARYVPSSHPETLPSMLQDLLAGRAMEVEEVFTDLIDRADQAGVPVPRITLVRDILRGLNHLPTSE